LFSALFLALKTKNTKKNTKERAIPRFGYKIDTEKRAHHNGFFIFSLRLKTEQTMNTTSWSGQGSGVIERERVQEGKDHPHKRGITSPTTVDTTGVGRA